MPQSEDLLTSDLSYDVHYFTLPFWRVQRVVDQPEHLNYRWLKPLEWKPLPNESIPVLMTWQHSRWYPCSSLLVLDTLIAIAVTISHAQCQRWPTLTDQPWPPTFVVNNQLVSKPAVPICILNFSIIALLLGSPLIRRRQSKAVKILRVFHLRFLFSHIRIKHIA